MHVASLAKHVLERINKGCGKTRQREIVREKQDVTPGLRIA
jgi:hypothetical protein